MDMDAVVLQSAPKNEGAFTRWLIRIVAVLLVVASTVLAVWCLQPPRAAIDFDTISSPDEIKDGEVYLIHDMLAAGIFMYMGDAEQKGTPRASKKGIYLEKEYVYSYHTLALTEKEDGSRFLMVFSVKNSDGEIFDRIAEHDKSENIKGDTGEYLPLSVYVKAKKLGSEASAAFTKSKNEYGSAVGMDKLNWVYYEMKYYCDADESFVDIAKAEKREWIKISVYVLPIALLLFGLSFIKKKTTIETDI